MYIDTTLYVNAGVKSIWRPVIANIPEYTGLQIVSATAVCFILQFVRLLLAAALLQYTLS